MTTMRPFQCDDLFRFSSTNLDPLTETYNMGFYLGYLARFPAMCIAQESPNGKVMGYILGKAEGRGTDWHGHISAVTVAPEYRRLGLARTMCDELERISDKVYKGYFVDLFVRVTNTLAITMYQKFGYTVFRRVLDYYGGEEDAFDMRKALSRDVDKTSVIPLKRPIKPEEMWPSQPVKAT